MTNKGNATLPYRHRDRDRARAAKRKRQSDCSENSTKIYRERVCAGA
jgi:hypothetical protein